MKITGFTPGSTEARLKPGNSSRRNFLHALSLAALGRLFPGTLFAAASKSQPIFSDVTAESGIAWRHFSGISPARHLIEIMGGGVGFLDFDNDGWLDLFLLNGGETPAGKSDKPLRNALYRNLGSGKFVDVASEAGLAQVKNYGMGVAIADFDNDGYPDIFVTGYPKCLLFHNNGNGTFTDVTADAGLQNQDRWASSAAWFDYDRDGFLDLIVCNYADMSFARPAPKCEYLNVRTYCEQKAYQGMPLAIYHNNRNGTFTDVSRSTGLERLIGRALGVVAVDFDDDGWQDLFVARDASPNLLLMNKRDGTFADVGVEAEVAFDNNGNAKAGMGVDAGDVDADGRPDVVVTNFNFEYHSLFLNRQRFPFEDWTRSSQLAGSTRLDVGWGVHFLDFDNDGRLDLMIVNGHVTEVIESLRPEVRFRERPLLLHNRGDAVFEDVSSKAGAAFSKQYLARGLAVGDWDNDGGIDAIFTCIGESPVLLRNNLGRHQSWIGLSLVGVKSNRDAIGAKCTVRVGSRNLVRWITGGSSYLSSHDKRVLFGLGNLPSTHREDVEIVWPNGGRQIVPSLAINRYHRIAETDLKEASRSSTI